MKKFSAFSDFSTETLYDLGFLVIALFFIILINPFYFKESGKVAKSDFENHHSHINSDHNSIDSANWLNI